jgi:hypothetical protein
VGTLAGLADTFATKVKPRPAFVLKIAAISPLSADTESTWWGLKIGHPRQSFLLTGGSLIRKRTVNSEKKEDTLIYIEPPIKIEIPLF